MSELSKEDLAAKKSIERSNKIASIYRQKQELDRLTAELDSARAKYDTAEKSSAYKKEINQKIEAQKKKLSSSSKSILSSSDKELVSEYKKTLGSDKDIAKAVNYNSNKRVMAKKNTDKNYREAVGDYKNKREELEYLKNKLGEDSKEYKEKKEDLDGRVALAVYKDQEKKSSELKSQLESAEKNKDWSKANEISSQIKQYDSNKYDFAVTKDVNGKEQVYRNHPTQGKIKFGTKYTTDKELDLDYDDIYKAFESSAPKQSEAKKEFTPIKDPNLSETNNDGSGSGYQEDTPADVDDLKLVDSDGNVDDVVDGTKTEKDWQGEFDKANSDLEALRGVNQDDFVHDYAPDNQGDGNGLEGLIDAGKGIVGMIGATEEVPEYSRGAMFNEAMGDSQRMKNDGLSSEELDVRKRFAERGYAYDVKNIRRMAGGSAGVALGNLGRATGQLQDEYSKIAATDEAVRRGNQGAFRSMALQDENINRQIFKDDLAITLANKEAGAGLVQDALSNISERSDFNKQFGKGSVFYEREKTLDRKAKMAMHDLEKGNNRRVYDAENEILQRRDAAAKHLEDNSELTLEGNSNDRKSMFKDSEVATEKRPTATYQDGKIHKGGSTLKKTTTDLAEEPKKKSMFKGKKSSKKERVDKLVAQMDEMSPDNPDFMKLSKELDGLKL